jgi:hypothetical protein
VESVVAANLPVVLLKFVPLVSVKLVAVDVIAALKVVDNPDVAPEIVTLFDVLYMPWSLCVIFNAVSP